MTRRSTAVTRTGDTLKQKLQEVYPIRAVFIRHGQSTANIGLPCTDIALIELTDHGWEQARTLAAGWTESPDRIILSPFLRTQQTALPTRERFPDVPVETWPIQEFCYLQPHRWTSLTDDERWPHVQRYWNAADPDFCDGEGAESFNTLLQRAQDSLDRLSTLPSDDLVFVFSHGQFIQAVCALLTKPHLDAVGKMQSFWQQGDDTPLVGNTDQIWTGWDGAHWRFTGRVRAEALQT